MIAELDLDCGRAERTIHPVRVVSSTVEVVLMRVLAHLANDVVAMMSRAAMEA